ncbi:DUF6531 domain-containing protein [Galactobacter sp.]|uniref:DUF6531 domain-containing protein n=1 Tax=Galactobacter sp. TaxID=2676125 RepID=UPI0025B7C658|nr:DUF6531 domain-containing protein [Galactobacter sp.]
MIDISQAPSGKLKDLGKDRVPALVEIQVCFDYAGAPAASKLQCTTNKSKKPVQVTKLPHAFGDNYPTAEAGDGQVALTTGELNLSDTDIEVDAGNTGLSISRTYSSYSGIGANSRIFGSGWRANIDGPDEGLSELLVVESTGLDGTITFIDDDESAAVFRQAGNGRVAGKVGDYLAANDNAAGSGWKVKLEGKGTAARITVIEDDGTRTTFKRGSNLESNTKIFEWVPESVSGPNVAGKSTFVTDAETGLITKIISGTETSSPDCTAGLVKGCRALLLSYDQKTSKGDLAKGKVAKVVYTAWDADAGKMSTVPIAEYSYSGTSGDANLTSVKDSRTGDMTTYTYGADSAAGVPLVASVTEKASNGSLTGAPTYYNYGKANGTAVSTGGCNTST